MKEWFTLTEIADLKLPDMPSSVSKVHEMAMRLNWGRGELCRKSGKRGGGFEYHMSLLPQRAQVMLAAIVSREAAREETREKRKKLYWTRWDAMTEDHRSICHMRMQVITQVESEQEAARLTGSVETKKDLLARVLDRHGVSKSSYYGWLELIKGVDREDWLPALAPKYAEDGTADRQFAECHPMAWDALKSDFLRPEKPSFSSCYRRMRLAAAEFGWAPIPSESALRNRLNVEVDKSVQIYAREGKKKAEQLYPPQIREKNHLHAMEIVNTDGHKIDLFVWAPWNEKAPVRVILIGIQDVYSGKILSWRLASAETWDVVRACIGDMIEDYGIPKHFYMDNGRAFASKAISGGAKHRNRFRKAKKTVETNRIVTHDDGGVHFEVQEDEFGGILKNFGIEAHFTRPYAGQSKPIERAWKDIAAEVSQHPAMAGCYTGNRPDAKPENYRSKAVKLEVLQAHVAARIAEHNARTGRKSATAAGRSFDQTFEESMRHPSTIIARATEAQRLFWLLAEKEVSVRKIRGEIHHLDNVYWSEALTNWRGKKVKIRFDPDQLHEPVKVYAPDGSLICEAPCTERGKFRDVDSANHHNRNRRAYVKKVGELADLNRKISAEKLGEIYSAGDGEKGQKQPIRPAITRLATAKKLALATDDDVFTDLDLRAGLAASLSEISGDSSIIPFRPQKRG